jgi:hypothetical protein
MLAGVFDGVCHHLVFFGGLQAEVDDVAAVDLGRHESLDDRVVGR